MGVLASISGAMAPEKNAKPKQCMDRLQEDSRKFRNGDSGGESLGRGQRLGIPRLSQQPFPSVPPNALHINRELVSLSVEGRLGLSFNR